MTTLEAEIAERLEHAASLIHTPSRLPAITAADENQDWFVGRPKSWERIVAVAALAAITLAGAAFALALDNDAVEVEVAALDEALVTFDLDLPVPDVSELLPVIENPPAAFGEGRRAEREGQQRQGRWTSAAIAKATDDGYEQPIVISILRGDAFYLREATPLGENQSSQTLGDLVSFTDGPWNAIATRTDPMVTVSGAVELSTLLDVLDAMAPVGAPIEAPAGAPVEAAPSRFSFDTGQLPDGYTLIVEPTALGQDLTPRNVVADDFQAVSINEVSDRANALLAASMGGGRLQIVTVGDATGWAGTYDNDEFGRLRSLIWSPEPGVVLELSVVAERWPLTETVALAEAITMVSPDEWMLRYPD